MPAPWFLRKELGFGAKLASARKLISIIGRLTGDPFFANRRRTRGIVAKKPLRGHHGQCIRSVRA